MRTRIHIHQQRLKQKLPPIIVRTYKGVRYAKRVKVNSAEIIWSEEPLDCGARVWISTDEEVEILEE